MPKILRERRVNAGPLSRWNGRSNFRFVFIFFVVSVKYFNVFVYIFFFLLTEYLIKPLGNENESEVVT